MELDDIITKLTYRAIDIRNYIICMEIYSDDKNKEMYENNLILSLAHAMYLWSLLEEYENKYSNT